jgi:glycine/D-amino acid oxidase-like deaminating enzyme
LARGWGDGATVALHQVSFDMMEQLAAELQIGSYRKLPTLSVSATKRGTSAVGWLDCGWKTSLLDDETAQVTPLELTEKLLQAAVASGCEVIIGSVNGVCMENDTIRGVHVENFGFIDADTVVVAAGAWTGVCIWDWFGYEVPLVGVKSTSIVFPGLKEIVDEPFACFVDEDTNKCHLELFPRQNGDLYVCGCGGSDSIKGDRLRPGGDAQTADNIEPDMTRVTAACQSLSRLTSLTGTLRPGITQVM